MEVKGCRNSERVFSNGTAWMRSSSGQTAYPAIYASVRLPVSLVSAFSIVKGHEAVIAFAQVPCIWDVNIQNFAPKCCQIPSCVTALANPPTYKR